jgi:hypothetical protein
VTIYKQGIIASTFSSYLKISLDIKPPIKIIEPAVLSRFHYLLPFTQVTTIQVKVQSFPVYSIYIARLRWLLKAQLPERPSLSAHREPLRLANAIKLFAEYQRNPTLVIS